MKNSLTTLCNEPVASLLHNSGVPPRSVIAYQGLGGLARTAGPGGSGLAGVSFGKQQAPKIIGTPIRFRLPDDYRGLDAAQFLAKWRIESAAADAFTSSLTGFLTSPSTNDSSDLPVPTEQCPETALISLVNQRARELPLPDGCAAIAPKEEHPLLWADALSALTIFAKSTRSVWLRSKSPALAAGMQGIQLSLLVPPEFAHRLSKQQSSEPQ
jgi:hypothetical protein